MNKYTIIPILILISISFAFGEVIVDREMPSSTEVGSLVNISLKLKSTTNIDAFDVVEFVPHGWELVDWKVYGYDKTYVILEEIPTYTYKGKIRTAYHWSFKNGLGPSEVLLVYTLKVEEPGSQEFITVTTYPGGFNTNTTIMSVVPSKGVVFCGNGVCELGETFSTCPQDCPKVKVEVFDITPFLIVIAVAAIVIAILYLYTKYTKKMIKRHTAVEDLRAFLKLGLARGYTLREMVNALKGAGIDTLMIEEIAKDLKSLETGTKRLPPEAKVIEEIKKVVENLSKEDIDALYKELGIKKIGGKDES
ncbi:MAG: hypothetical protein J7K73_02575 [Nanoarchaeota archaeon]|nr:hypothetical protein [Nanoarchaeota archaeon]